MTEERLYTLFARYHKGEATPEEIAALQEYLQQVPDREAQLRGLLQRAWEEQDQPDSAFINYRKEEMWQHIVRKEPAAFATRRRMRYAVAAVFLLAAAIPAYLWLRTAPVATVVSAVPKDDVQPGHSGAVLRLSDGRTIVLDSAADGMVARQGDIDVVKKDGRISYSGTTTGDLLYNDVMTDRGRQWQLTLPDGTRVWLNAASSIRYPLAFTGNERLVEMSGEVFFDVAHNNKQPFRVKTGSLVIEDIGTAFNINAYTDERSVNTTLVEGKAKVYNNNKTVVLQPGQQARATGNELLTVNNGVNLEETTAWKDGMFHYEHADIQTILRQFARWYDITVHYEGAVPDDKYFMIMNRNNKLSSALKVLKAAGIGFRIEDQHLYVTAPAEKGLPVRSN